MTIPTTLLGSETHMLTASQTNRTYRITVSLPLGYHSEPDAEWPFRNKPEKWHVVYVLDGNWYGGMVTDMIRPMAWCGDTTDAIVVGIGYGDNDDPIKSFRESFTRRDLDLTPIHDLAVEEQMTKQHKRSVPNGDAAGFLSFIQNDLMPFIHKSYQADPTQQTLVGHSYGGLFAAYALFKAPGLFRSYIVGSPTLSYGNRYMFEQEKTFASENNKLPADVYVYVGDEEIIE